MVQRSILLLSLITACAVMASAKPDTWLEIRTPHFIILSNSGEKQARHIGDQFERMRALFHRSFPAAHVDAASPIVVIAVKDRKEFAALEPEAYLAKGQLNLAGLFLQTQDRNYVLLRLDVEGEHPYATVYHEYTHFVMSRAQGWMPLWLNEGLAQFYQNTDIRDKEVALGEADTANIVSLRQSRLMPLPTLFAVDYNSPYYHEENKGSIFYAESWALTHYLQVRDRQDKTERLLDYGKLVSQNVDPVTAATKAFGDLNQLQRNLERYVEQGAFYYFKVPGATEVNDAEFKVRALSMAQADAVRADFLACNQREKDAGMLLDRVLKEDPENVAAHETMGAMAYRAGNYAVAEKWYRETVKLDPQNFRAHYYYAVTAIQEGFSHDQAEQIESSLKAATKLNASFAPAFDQLAVFYGQQRKDLDEAYKLSFAAVQLEPSNIGFRVNWAQVLAQMERMKDAVTVLQAALKMAKSPEQIATIQSQIESFEHYAASREKEVREYEEERKRNSAEQQTVVQDEPEAVVQVEDDRHGPQRTVSGTVSGVSCSSPSTLRLKVAGKSKPLSLRTRNYFKVEYSALNFTPSANLNPCKDMEGMKAKIQYFEALTGSAEGQIISIELAK